MIGGPANLLSSAIAVDLGQQDRVAGNAMALATITGIVDGTVGAAAAVSTAIMPYHPAAIPYLRPSPPLPFPHISSSIDFAGAVAGILIVLTLTST